MSWRLYGPHSVGWAVASGEGTRCMSSMLSCTNHLLYSQDFRSVCPDHPPKTLHQPELFAEAATDAGYTLFAACCASLCLLPVVSFMLPHKEERGGAFRTVLGIVR